MHYWGLDRWQHRLLCYMKSHVWPGSPRSVLLRMKAVGGHWYLQCSSVGVCVWWRYWQREISFLLLSRAHPRRCEVDTAVGVVSPLYPLCSFLCIISIIGTPVCLWIFRLGLTFWGSFVQTCLHTQQLEGISGTLVLTFLETEVIIWLFLVVLVRNKLLDQSLIKVLMTGNENENEGFLFHV